MITILLAETFSIEIIIYDQERSNKDGNIDKDNTMSLKS